MECSKIFPSQKEVHSNTTLPQKNLKHIAWRDEKDNSRNKWNRNVENSSKDQWN